MQLGLGIHAFGVFDDDGAFVRRIFAKRARQHGKSDPTETNVNAYHSNQVRSQVLVVEGPLLQYSRATLGWKFKIRGMTEHTAVLSVLRHPLLILSVVAEKSRVRATSD
jgi:hypothetical protein